MKRMLLGMFAALGLCVPSYVAPAFGQDIRYTSQNPVGGDAAAYGAGCCAPCAPAGGCCDVCCDGCECYCQSLGVPWCDDVCGYAGIIAEAELTFFRYHRADGVRVGTDAGEDAEFDFEPAPRITVGWVGADGFGARARWWDYHHQGEAFGDPGAHMTVDTHIIDVELFDQIRLNNNWTMEVSGGVRFNDFVEHMRDPVEDRINAFEGFGGLVGLELERCLGPSSAVFARVRTAILMDDKFVFNEGPGNLVNQNLVLLDSVQGMLELAIGYEVHWDMNYGAQLYARATAEWQNWYNYSSAFDFQLDEEFFDGSSDVGFGGFAFAVGIGR